MYRRRQQLCMLDVHPETPVPPGNDRSPGVHRGEISRRCNRIRLVSSRTATGQPTLGMAMAMAMAMAEGVEGVEGVEGEEETP